MNRWRWFVTAGAALSIMASVPLLLAYKYSIGVFRLPLELLSAVLKPLTGLAWFNYAYFQHLSTRGIDSTLVRGNEAPWLYFALFYFAIGGFGHLFFKELAYRRAGGAETSRGRVASAALWLIPFFLLPPALGFLFNIRLHGNYLAVVTVLDLNTQKPLSGMEIGYEGDSPFVPFDSFADTNDEGKSLKGVNTSEPQAVCLVQDRFVPVVQFISPKIPYVYLRTSLLAPGVKPDDLGSAMGVSGRFVIAERSVSMRQSDSQANLGGLTFGFGLILDPNAREEAFNLRQIDISTASACDSPLARLTGDPKEADIWFKLDVQTEWHRFLGYPGRFLPRKEEPRWPTHITVIGQKGYEIASPDIQDTPAGTSWLYRHHEAPEGGWASSSDRPNSRGLRSMLELERVSGYQRSLNDVTGCASEDAFLSVARKRISEEHSVLKTPGRERKREYTIEPRAFFFKKNEVYGKVENVRIWVGGEGEKFVAYVAFDNIVMQRGPLGHRFLVLSNPEFFSPSELFLL